MLTLGQSQVSGKSKMFLRLSHMTLILLETQASGLTPLSAFPYGAFVSLIPVGGKVP